MFRYRLYGFTILGVTTLAILLALSVSPALAQESTPLPQDCILIHTYQDGRTLWLCPASEDGSPNPTATPEPTRTPTATATPISTQEPVPGDPYPEAPECQDHDPRSYHSLWNWEQGCHYNHHHGDNPHSVDDIFGQDYYSWAGGSISYPWQTISGSGCEENDCKHTGYVWLVERNQACESQYADGCVVAFRALAHAMSSSNSASVRYHSAWLEALVCREDSPDTCGIFRSGGWQDTGDLHIDRRIVIDVPYNFNRQKLHYAETGNSHFGTWYSSSPGGEQQRGGMWSVTVELGDLWGPINPDDPGELRFFCENPNDNCSSNGSRYQPHVIGIQFPPRLRRIVDADGDSVASFNGYADRWGLPVAGCTEPGLDCVPLIIENVPTDISYQGRFGYRDFDIYFDGSTSGWIKFPY